jgi:hypothetical protein
MVGETTKTGQNGEVVSYYIYTHRNFSISYNANRIIEVNVTNANPVLLQPANDITDLKFTYSTTWEETTDLYENRWAKYLDTDFFEVCYLSLLTSSTKSTGFRFSTRS